MITASVGNADIERRLARAPAHLHPILHAIRAGCAFAVVVQTREPFDFPAGRPIIAIIGDDLEESLGPAAFHRASLKRLVRRSASATIVSSAAQSAPYAAAAANAAICRHNVLIVETQLGKEQAWIEFVRRYRPEIPLIVATVAPMGSA